jgi:hypothetical protein
MVPWRTFRSKSARTPVLQQELKVAVASSHRRGELVEFRVRLAADPVFRFGTLMTEVSGMADEHPLMFAENNAFGFLNQMEPVNRILQRLLAGLIPIRAKAVDYVVVMIDDVEYVVHHKLQMG